MRTYELHWYGGKTEKVKGDDIANAFRRAGIGEDTLGALDYYREVVEDGEGFPAVLEDAAQLDAENIIFTNRLAALVRLKLDPETGRAFDELLQKHSDVLARIAVSLRHNADG